MSQFLVDPDDPDEVSSGSDASARSSTVRRRRRTLAVLAVSLLTVVALVVGGGLVYVHSIEKAIDRGVHRSALLPLGGAADQSSTQSPTDTGANSSSDAPDAKGGHAVNYVVMGSDSRDPADVGAGRSDVLMVAHLAADRKSAELISFPRDMWVTIPGHGKNKINAAYAFGGPQLTVLTLQNLLGVRMDHVVLADFAGFVALTDDIGGVTINNPYYSDEAGHRFPVGMITIKGEEALAYVRERHQLPHGDLDRAERQRLVVQAILAKALSPGMLADPVRFARFAADAANNVTVDNSMTPDEMRSTALSLRFSPKDVVSMQAPISGFGTSADGQSIDVVDASKLQEFAHALRTDTMPAYLSRYPHG